jgi:hypothetical protein
MENMGLLIDIVPKDSPVKRNEGGRVRWNGAPFQALGMNEDYLINMNIEFMAIVFDEDRYAIVIA